MRINFWILIILVTLWRCSGNHERSLKELLEEDVYWDIHDEGKTVVYAYKFYSDGTCKYLYTDQVDKVRREFDDDDNFHPKVWKLQDSIINFRSRKLKLININKDTLLLSSLNKNKYEIWIKDLKPYTAKVKAVDVTSYYNRVVRK